VVLPNWPADSVERWPVERLVPHARNARVHSDAQVAQIAASIREWGWTMPVLADEAGGLIAGHGRVMAAQKLGLDDIPVMTARGWSEAQKRAYVLADNKLALNASWDDELLGVELLGLQEMGADLSLIGFSADEVVALTAGRTVGLTDPDEVPEPPAEPVSRLGDVWIMGRHRLCCGDATSEADVALALGGVKPHLMVTDPPYGVDYDPDWRNRAPNIGWSRSISIGTVQNDKRANWREAWALFPGDVIYQWHPAGAMQVDHYNAIIAAGFDIRMQIIWAKPHFPVGRGNYHVQHEPCLYAVRKEKTAHWGGDRKQTTLWEIANRTAFRGAMEGPEDAWSGHGTQKPVECMKRPIENNSSPGQAVYDPFVGSGTTIIAAETTGRACHAIELHPPYVDVSVLRWQAFTGDAATLEATGQTYAETADARRP
jgi:DNA modification methylase